MQALKSRKDALVTVVFVEIKVCYNTWSKRLSWSSRSKWLECFLWSQQTGRFALQDWLGKESQDQRRSEVRCQRLKVRGRGQRKEASGQRSEARRRRPDARDQRQKVRGTRPKTDQKLAQRQERSQSPVVKGQISKTR